MLARNPKTGGTIKLMKSDASIWKNKKTLVWMKTPPSEDANRWRRWDIAIVGVDSALLEWQPQIVVLIDDSPNVRSWLATKTARDTRFILISSKIVDAIDDDEFLTGKSSEISSEFIFFLELSFVKIDNTD